jgi:hypothetical protein
MNRLLTCLLGLLLITCVWGQNLTLLVNQDFEDAAIGWGKWPEESLSRIDLDATVAQHGKQSLRLTATRVSDRAFATAPLARFEPNLVYRLGVYIRRSALVPDSAIGVTVNWRDPQTGVIKKRSTPAQVKVTRDGEWTLRSGLIVAPADGTQAQVLLSLEYATGVVWFDNIQIEKLGPPSELKSDVWTNQTIGVEIGSGPISRYAKHKADNDAIYQMGARYNALVFNSAFAESFLRDVERAAFYAGKEQPADLRQRWDESDQQLNATYSAYIKAFKSKTNEDSADFADRAHELATSLTTLRMALEEKLTALRPERIALPPHFGLQPRSVKALEPNGRMNRLLFGAWSPTQFSEWERPFDLEFHSAGPGAPKVHTETETDFSNITQMCDDLQKLGYAGTFGMLNFGLHEYIYAPQWLLDKYRDEPDFFKLSQDGLKGKSSSSNHSLNWLHPAVRAYIKDYLTKYATFCKNERRILFYEVAQEAYPDFNTDKGRRQTGYGPHGEAAFRTVLQGKYKTIAALNREWGTSYADFAAIQPPPDAYMGRQEVTPLVAEFEAFRDDAYVGYLKLIYDSLKAADPDKPVVARHSALLSSINGARLFETCDVLSYHRGAPQMQLGNVYLNSLNRYAHKGLGYMEDFWGKQEEQGRVWDERAQRRGLEKHISDVSMWGRTLQMKWYAYTSGSYLFTYNGNWFNPQWDLTTVRYCAPGLAVAKRKMEQLDWVLTHSTIAPSKILVLQPSATMRNERPDTNVYGLMLTIHDRLGLMGMNPVYEIVPEEYFQDGRAKLSDFNVVIVPAGKYLAASLQQQLVHFAKSDSKLLILIGENGTCDELGRPCGVLGKALGADHTATDLWRGGKEVKTGNGMAWIIPELGRLQDGMDFPKMVDAYAPPEVTGGLLRVTDDGERYLFLLNRNVDHPATPYVHSRKPVKEAIDVLVPGGCPAPVQTDREGSTIKVRLGPGETAVLWLR